MSTNNNNKRKAVEDLKKVLTISELNEKKISLMELRDELSREVESRDKETIEALKKELDKKNEIIDTLRDENVRLSVAVDRANYLFTSSRQDYVESLYNKDKRIEELKQIVRFYTSHLYTP